MKKIIILGHENPDVDSIVSGYLLQKILNSKGYFTEFVIPDEKIEQENLNICRKYGLDPAKFQKKIDLDDKDAKYILVDHNERNLGGEIIIIIDHHPTTKDIKINDYYNKNISSTACYICDGTEHLLNKNDLKLAVLATMVDTASFNSTKGREEDKIWAINICNRYGLDYNELYKEGLCLTSLDDVEKVSFNGRKKYNFSGNKVESSYIQIENPLDNIEKINQILEILKKHVKEESLDAFVFIVHNMKEFKTMYYLITKNEIIERHYEEYTSRGNSIMPEVEKKIK